MLGVGSSLPRRARAAGARDACRRPVRGVVRQWAAPIRVRGVRAKWGAAAAVHPDGEARRGEPRCALPAAGRDELARDKSVGRERANSAVSVPRDAGRRERPASPAEECPIAPPSRAAAELPAAPPAGRRVCAENRRELAEPTAPASPARFPKASAQEPPVVRASAPPGVPARPPEAAGVVRKESVPVSGGRRRAPV